LPVADAMERLHSCRTKYYADTNAGLLPPIVHRGRASFVPEAELDVVMAATVSGYSDEQLRELVKQLVGKRAEVLMALTGVAA
jgi:hypothetical protein